MKRALLVVVAACTNEVDLPWQLDHERIIAVRATPPQIASGETSAIDALLGHKGAPPDVGVPDEAAVVSPSGFERALAHDATGWTVTAPSDAQLAATRTMLGLDPGAPVPMQIDVAFDATGLHALKIVWLGDHVDNPVIDPVTIDGADALTQTQLSVAALTDIPLQVGFDDTYDINWLTSCGTMHDFDLAKAYLRVEAADPHDGTLGVVVRDHMGGVGWVYWPITAE